MTTKRTTDGITYHLQRGTNTIWKVTKDTRKGFAVSMRKRSIRVTRNELDFYLGRGCEVVWF